MGAVLCKEDCRDFSEKVESRAASSHCPWYSDVDIDWNGCRKFARLPQVGEHPRLFFTKDELPRIVARFTHSDIAPALRQNLEYIQRRFLKSYDLDSNTSISDEEKENPCARETIDAFFTSDYNRNLDLLGAYAFAVIYDDEELADKAKRFALFFSKVILRSREMAIEEDVRDKPYDVWHSDDWNVGIQILFGGSCFALLYDIIYNDLSEDERAIMRNAITTCVQGRRSWGVGWPTRRIQSNWACYHGDLYNLAAVVEGEEGADEEVCTLFADLSTHYLDYAIYDSGHPIEDAYSINLALREGSLCFLAMARRGHNLFNHPHYKKIWTGWVPYAFEPNNTAKIYGGSSGNVWIYPTSIIMAKYMFPKDLTVDHVYRHFMCEGGKNYSRFTKIQCRLPVLAFAIPALSIDLTEPEAPEKLDLPLEFICRDRGKVIMRSDWSDNAMCFTFDARPDAFLIGHDACSRGAFVLNADGRNWAFCPEWKFYPDCSDYSLPLIDGIGQQAKAPSAKMLEVMKGERYTYASADLSYAYNWTWSNWAKEGQDWTSKGYEIEPSDPRDFNYNVWWAPHKMFDEKHVGFVGLHYWRKRIAEVERVFRSAIMVRAEKPFVIIADDVKKDDEEHDYTWAMSTPYDVDFVEFDGKEAVLKDSGDPCRRFGIRVLNDEELQLSCSFRKIDKDNPNMLEVDAANQVVLSCRRACGLQLLVMLYSIGEDDESGVMETGWSEDGNVLNVRNRRNDEVSKLFVGCGDHGETTLLLMP